MCEYDLCQGAHVCSDESCGEPDDHPIQVHPHLRSSLPLESINEMVDAENVLVDHHESIERG